MDTSAGCSRGIVPRASTSWISGEDATMDASILTDLKLSCEQRRAAYQAGCDTAVLAGAGCGKTSTLVGHYLYLLEQGLAPDEIVAITFTERAGQEMRVRIRERLREHLAANPAGRSAWLERYLALDGAPIGTIHSFCARLLRAHPAEAALDPDFVVVDESEAAALAAEAVERALVWAAGEPQAAACFPILGGPLALRRLVFNMLLWRLEVAEAFELGGTDVLARWRQAQKEWLDGVLRGEAWQRCLDALVALAPLHPGDRLDDLRRAALEAVRAARRCVAEGDCAAALDHLAAGLRRPGNVGSRKDWGEAAGEVRAALRVLSDLYRDQVHNVAGKADPALDEELAAAWPGLVALFRQAVRDYEALKAQRRAVDFDDLEAGALRLLETCPEVAGYRRGRARAVLVDEFQDTNDRQRRLIEALLGAPAGEAGRLFIVGDAKQSIYRFRGADVTVFRRVEGEIAGAGGQVHTLDRTYRAHEELVEILNDLLRPVLEGEQDEARLYRVPFARLRAGRDRPARLRPPFLELHLGLGDAADEGRRVAAAMLGERLMHLHQGEGMAWSEVACLFRATTHFAVYEEAFERAGIPYVTVAGRGFFERPEVRDLLNALRAIANPTDDLALAGLLRSPAIGLTDASLYLLRRGPDGWVRPLWPALRGGLGALEPGQQERAHQAAGIIEEVRREVGRQPVATVLKRFLDLTGYRAILRLCPDAERAGRNVDKLLADAHRSGAVGVGDFSEYVRTLRDTAAREGEAPPEAGQAVQLMSVHKAKGLEFGVVVIADAGHDDRPHIPDLMLHPEWGVLLRVTRAEGSEKRYGLAHGLARQREEEMQDAEERRLLYVAATRAREKLLVSGHAGRTKAGLSLRGWVKRLGQALGGDLAMATAPEPGEQMTFSLWQGRVSCLLQAASHEESARETQPPVPLRRPDGVVPTARVPASLVSPCWAASKANSQPVTPSRVWRVVPRRPGRSGPHWVVGRLVHVGLQLWRFEDEPVLVQALGASARSAGLTGDHQIVSTVHDALRLLARFRQSELYHELNQAAERYHELPYACEGRAHSWGRIDLLCRCADDEWWLVDFKTNRLQSEAALEDAAEEYAQQLRGYGQAVKELLGQDPRLLLCFLDYQRAVLVREVTPAAPGSAG